MSGPAERNVFPMVPKRILLAVATLLLVTGCEAPSSVVIVTSTPEATLPVPTSTAGSAPVGTAIRPTATPAAAPSGIEGQALIGPTCPVQRQDSPCPDQPYQASIQVLGANRELVLEFQTDTQGSFRVELEPGTYTLAPLSPGVHPRAEEQVVRVEEGRFTEVIIQYDSGIR